MACYCRLYKILHGVWMDYCVFDSATYVYFLHLIFFLNAYCELLLKLFFLVTSFTLNFWVFCKNVPATRYCTFLFINKREYLKNDFFIYYIYMLNIDEVIILFVCTVLTYRFILKQLRYTAKIKQIAHNININQFT